MTDRPDSSRECLSDLEPVCRRVREKLASYDQYNFSRRYNDFLKAFFDLCQEYDSLEDFYRICVAVPLEMTGLACAFYLYSAGGKQLQLVCDSGRGFLRQPESAPSPVRSHHEAYENGTSFLVPVYSKSPLDPAAATLGHEVWSGANGAGRVFGILEMRPLSDLSEIDKFFFVKYANRIGYNLHNRLIAQQNVDHLKFISNLVMDIEHNVIVPNMYFKHIFNQLKKKIDELGRLKAGMQRIIGPDHDAAEIDDCFRQCDEIQMDMRFYHQELVKHHANVTLFLESLFRREHFERGHLVLRPKRCFVEREVVLPQLEHYASRLRAAKVTVDRPQNMQEEELQILVDVGLLAQVYANLFSNAAKYTAEITGHHGLPRKAMAYGRELVVDYPEKGRQGIKFNVFTTGPHLSEEEREKLFQEGMRGHGSKDIPGSGHGLAFIKHVIELHGGSVGYEATPEGNNFYFILPVPPLALPPALIGPAS